MKKRILSILLLCCMVLTLLPTAAFAADTGKAIQLGTDALSKNVNTASAPTVYFGQDHENNPAAWRVIGYNGNGVASAQGDMTLLAAGNMSSVLQFADFGTNNRYASSYLKTAIDALAEKLTTEENTAVKKRTLTSGSYNGENTDCVAGEQVDNAVFWPLSTAEAFAVNQDLRIVDPEHPSWASSYWWLRSPGYSDHDAATVNGDGSVVYSGNAISSWWCVRPAFNLNSSSVLFTSAAVGGKPDGGLTPISKYTGNEWKLTLKDSNRNFAVTETTVSGDPGDTVTLHYTGATAGINEYISVILADNSGAQYYGRVAQPTAENGTVEIKIPSGLAPGSYTLKVFSEQCNDDKKTDYASDFVDIDLTVGYQEQFTLTPGGVYYFDLSGVSIPGTANGSLPDKTMHYVPFTYAGTVDAYKLTSEMATTEEYAQQNEYAHSLFVADYAVTHAVSWDDLNATGLIFGKGYATGSVDYTLRAPSGGSGGTGSGALERGTPQSNEWDRILDKDDGYIKNWRDIGSWGQDTLPNTLSNRVIRGRYDLPRKYAGANTTLSFKFLGFRPVLEVLNSDTLGSDGLKAVTLDLGGGKFGGSSDTIQIIVKTGESFTAPASDGLTRPDGNTGSYFMWRDNDGQLYAPGDNVPVDVTKLTAQFVPPEQFTLAPGGTYYFDLSGVSIPGTVNDALPDNTLHYVPFTYAGTVDAYKLTSEMATTEEYAEQNKYAHSLFVADYTVTHTISWNDLNTAGLIFGKGYAAGGVDYTLRAPSAGSSSTGPSFSIHGAPQSNEWDRILDKDERYIQNIVGLYSWGQDTPSASASQRVGRGYYPLRGWSSAPASYQTADAGFRPVLEVLGLDKLGYDGLKAVTLDLGGGTLGGSSEDIQIIVKNSSVFTAPASNGLTRPDGDTGSYFKWLGSDGNLYAPGDSVPANVNKLTAQFAPSSHSVTITTDTLPDGKVGEAYSQTLTATGTAPITWSIDGGLPAGLSLNADTGEISGTPTAEGTATFTVKATNSAGSNTKELSITITKAAPAEHTITVTTEGGGTASASSAKAVVGTEIRLTAKPDEGYRFKEWQVISGGVTIKDDKFTMPDSDVEVKAIFEEDAPPAPTDPAKPSISVTGTYTYNGSVHTATVNGYDPTTMDISGNTATDAGDYTVSVTSNTGKWADDSTDAVTAEWSIGKATQEAPNGLIGVAPTTEGGSDGKITGVDSTMEYRMAGESSYTACSGTEIENLSAGNYFVRYAEDNNHFAGTDAEVTVGKGAPLADCTITFDGNGGSGSMGPVTVKAGTNYILPDCGFTAPADQEFKAWEIGGTEYEVGNFYTVNGDTEIKALWENSVITPTTYTVTVNNDGNGTASATPSAAEALTEITLTAKPDEGYRFKEWEVISGGVSIKDDKFTMPSANVEVKAIFEKDAPTEFTITFDGNGGTPSVGSMTTANQKLTSLPSASRSGSYSFDGWYTKNSGGTKVTTATVFSANTTVYAHWTYTGGGGSSGYSYYTIKATAGAGGSISPSGNVSVREGRDQTFTITPDKGYAVANVKIDGKSIGAVKSYTFENVRRTHTIEVIFMKANGNPQTGVFVDVATGSYYEDAVDWAVENGITKGTDDTHFSPDGICTRVQAVTFLWRAAGSPKPETRTMPFTDVPVGSYYYDAVLWAVENGITMGTSDTTFSPNATCSRAQIVAFLWRSEKSPAAGTANPFADVKSDAYYADAVLWAVKENITKGTTSTTFSPNADCTRAQIVTFLWRCKK